MGSALPTGEDDGLQDLTQATQEPTQELTLQDLYEQICRDEDIIITIDAIEESRVRKGLSSIKSKYNSKLKDNNLPIDTSTLEFIVHDSPADKAQGRVRLQIYLKKAATIKVHSIIVPEEDGL